MLKFEFNLEVGCNIYEVNVKNIKFIKIESKINGEILVINGVFGIDEFIKMFIIRVNCYNCGIDCMCIYYYSF